MGTDEKPLNICEIWELTEVVLSRHNRHNLYCYGSVIDVFDFVHKQALRYEKAG